MAKNSAALNLVRIIPVWHNGFLPCDAIELFFAKSFGVSAYSVVFFRRMSETDDEPQHFGHLARARHAPTKPHFPTFWCDSGILRTPPCVWEHPPRCQ